MTIEYILRQIHPLPDKALQKILARMEAVALPKGHLVFQAGRVETSVYFIKSGIARAWALQDGNEVTFWFGQEGDTIISMKSYIAGEPGYENIELLEDSELYHLKNRDLHELYQADIDIANWGRKFAEGELIRTEARFISRQFRTASERYRDLLRENPALLQRVQLGHIASYLGITQVSLSRVRKSGERGERE